MAWMRLSNGDVPRTKLKNSRKEEDINGKVVNRQTDRQTNKQTFS